MTVFEQFCGAHDYYLTDISDDLMDYCANNKIPYKRVEIDGIKKLVVFMVKYDLYHDKEMSKDDSFMSLAGLHAVNLMPRDAKRFTKGQFIDCVSATGGPLGFIVSKNEIPGSTYSLGK